MLVEASVVGMRFRTSFLGRSFFGTSLAVLVAAGILAPVICLHAAIRGRICGWGFKMAASGLGGFCF
jgi:hypothetical protein